MPPPGVERCKRDDIGARAVKYGENQGVGSKGFAGPFAQTFRVRVFAVPGNMPARGDTYGIEHLRVRSRIVI